MDYKNSLYWDKQEFLANLLDKSRVYLPLPYFIDLNADGDGLKKKLSSFPVIKFSENSRVAMYYDILNWTLKETCGSFNYEDIMGIKEANVSIISYGLDENQNEALALDVAMQLHESPGMNMEHFANNYVRKLNYLIKKHNFYLKKNLDDLNNLNLLSGSIIYGPKYLKEDK